MTRETTPRKIPPWQWVAIGVGLALVGLLTRGSFEPFSVLAFVLAGGFAFLLRERRRSTWLSVGCGLLVALGTKFWIVDFKVIKSDLMAPRIQQNARVFYRPAFFRARPGDLVIFKPQEPAPTSKTYLGQVKKLIDGGTYEIVRLANNEGMVVARREIKGKIIGVANPPE